MELTVNHPSCDLRQQRAGVADIPCAFAALDLGEDRLQQGAGIVPRAHVAPQPGEVSRGAQFQHARFLASGDFDRFEEAGLRPRTVWLLAFEGDLAHQTMQLGQSKPLPRLLNKGERLLQRGVGRAYIACPQ